MPGSMRLTALALVALSGAGAAPGQEPTQAPEPPAPIEQKPTLSVAVRLQGWLLAERDGAPDGGVSQDFLLRRGYLALTGTLSSSVSAFAHLAGDRLGQNGLDAPGLGVGTGLALRDAWVAWRPHAAFVVQAGRMCVPFTRAFGTESSFALVSLDLPQTQGGGRGAAFYPSRVGRDDGVVVWGTPWGGRLQYRVGVLEGVEGAANPSDSLRFVGRVSLNLLEPEMGWFNRGSYLGAKRVLAFGVGVDRQADLVLGEAGERGYRAWTVDAFYDRPLGRGVLTAEASYSDARGLPNGLPFAGIPVGGRMRAGYVQAGYLLPGRLGPGRLQLYARAERVFASEGDSTSLPAAGVHYLVRGHDLKLSLDWSRAPRGTPPPSSALILQAQVFF